MRIAWLLRLTTHAACVHKRAKSFLKKPFLLHIYKFSCLLQNSTEQYFFFKLTRYINRVSSSQGPITTSSEFQIINFVLFCCYVQVKLFLSNYWQKESSIFWTKSSQIECLHGSKYKPQANTNQNSWLVVWLLGSNEQLIFREKIIKFQCLITRIWTPTVACMYSLHAC